MAVWLRFVIATAQHPCCSSPFVYKSACDGVVCAFATAEAHSELVHAKETYMIVLLPVLWTPELHG